MASLSAHKAVGEEAARNRQRIEVLAALPENKVCADCPLLGPRWISINLGVFVCLPCSGIHRNLGVHISKMRSVSMDALNDDWLDNMAAWGNAKANAEWQANLPAGYPLPTATDADNQTAVLDRFIRDKYERQLFKKGAAKRAAAAPLVAPPTAKPAGGGWNDADDDWGVLPAPRAKPLAAAAVPAAGRAAPSVGQPPSAEPPPPPAAPPPPARLDSGAYSTGTMQGFGNTDYLPPQPSGGLLSGALSGLFSATASVMQSAVPLVQRSVESARPLVANLSSNLGSYASGGQEAQGSLAFDAARDLSHLKLAGADGSGGFSGFGADDDDDAAAARRMDAYGGGGGGGGEEDDGWGAGWKSDQPPARSAGAARDALSPSVGPSKPLGFFGRLRSRSTEGSEPALSRDISDLLKQPGEDDEQQPQDDAARLERLAPSKRAGRDDDAREPTVAGVSGARAAADEPAGAGARVDNDSGGWSAAPATGRAGAASGMSLKSRARTVPAAAKPAADDDDWGSNW